MVYKDDITTLGKRAWIVTCSSKIEGYKIVNYIGFVWSEEINYKNVLADIFNKIKTGLTGAVQKYEDIYDVTKHRALLELEKRALQRGGNALINVRMDTEVTNGMASVHCFGDAVYIQKDRDYHKALEEEMVDELREIDKDIKKRSKVYEKMMERKHKKHSK